ncbi:MAG: ABC transporter permease [Thermobacillus sp. ZCTH02-B1]|nr:carbohydrate ABC transporter permease [Thermobacillus sp. ZCTH02-B1]OUM94471.1 MAG: ABC transporter permease [Thermobacillus sp. ZCTH02-B1]
MYRLVSRLILVAGAFVSLFPFYWTAVAATNPSGKVFAKPPQLVPGSMFLENLFNLNASIGIFRVLFNSTFVTCVYTLFSLTVCTMAGYAFAKFRFPGRNALFSVFLVSLMVPYHATLIPLFKMMASWEWINTYLALIFPNVAYPFAIFLMRQNLLAMPDAVMEAARIDGVGEWRLFVSIVLPSMRPALAAAAIYLFVYQWNNFLWPLVATSTKEMYTLPVALSSLIGLSRIDYGQVMTGVTIATGPIVAFFLILQRQFISGILGGAIKE